MQETKCAKPFMDISRWGPAYWSVFHITSFDLDVKATLPGAKARQSERALRLLLENFPDTLPCEICSNHLKKIYTMYPPPQSSDKKSKNAVARWSVWVHNKVNERLGKPVLSFDDVVRLYFHCGPPPQMQHKKHFFHASINSNAARVEKTGGALVFPPVSESPISSHASFSWFGEDSSSSLETSVAVVSVTAAAAGAMTAKLITSVFPAILR